LAGIPASGSGQHGCGAGDRNGLFRFPLKRQTDLNRRAQRTQRSFHSVLRALRDPLFTNLFDEAAEMRWQETRPAGIGQEEGPRISRMGRRCQKDGVRKMELACFALRGEQAHSFPRIQGLGEGENRQNHGGTESYISWQKKRGEREGPCPQITGPMHADKHLFDSIFLTSACPAQFLQVMPLLSPEKIF